MESSSSLLETESLGEGTVGGSFNREQVVSLARESLNFLASLLMPIQFIYEFPPLHLTVWSIFLKHISESELPNPSPKQKFPQVALGWPRAHLKTTLVKLIICWAIIFSQKKFILVVASNLSKAENILADIFDMLKEENVRQIWGDWTLFIEKDTASLKKITFNGKTVILAAIGSGGDPRGLNLKNERPDMIIMDDMQSRENSKSPVQSKELLGWMNSTLKKAKSPHGCVFIYVGNMFSSAGCILKILRKNEEWISVIVAGILADGSALWPELRSKEELIQELKEDIAMGTPEAFFSEIMNDENAGITSCFDISKVPICPFPDRGELATASFVIIDVATEKIGADDTTINYYEVLDGTPVTSEIINGVFSPGDTIKRTLQLCLEKGCFLVAVESVAYQSSLLYWFNKICLEIGIEGIHFVEVFPKGRPKNNRILSMFKSLLGSKVNDQEGKPDLYIRDHLRAKVFWEISQFNPAKKNNTDNILGNMAYAQDVIADYAELIWNPLSVESIAFSDASVLEHNSAF